MPKTQKTWKLMGAGNRQEYELRHLKLTMTRKITIFHTDSGGYSCYIIRPFHAESWWLAGLFSVALVTKVPRQNLAIFCFPLKMLMLSSEIITVRTQRMAY